MSDDGRTQKFTIGRAEIRKAAEDMSRHVVRARLTGVNLEAQLERARQWPLEVALKVDPGDVKVWLDTYNEEYAALEAAYAADSTAEATRLGVLPLPVPAPATPKTNLVRWQRWQVKLYAAEQYKAVILAQRDGGDQARALALDASQAKYEQTWAAQAPDHRAIFAKMLNEEVAKLAASARADTARLFRELGITAAPAQPVRRAPSLGEEFVRTAVRATAWEAVFSLFRALGLR